jgi:hemoglobin
MRSRILGVVVLLVGVGAVSRADDKPLDRLEVDKRVVTAVYQSALLGTELWNKDKNYDGAFRLYQGTLLAVQPLLDHRPNLMKSVKEKLEKAKSLKAAEGAFVLREALDEIQNEIAPGKKLWDRLGGEKAVRVIVRDFMLTVIEDKDVNFLRDGKYKLDAKGVARLEQLLVELVSVVSGGPLPYSEKRTLQEAHAGMKITDKEFDALMGVLQKTLDKHKVGKADAEELLTEVNKTRVVIVETKN